MQSIASLCPLEDGPAVIMARNMLSIYNYDSLYSNECERNGEQQQRTAGSKKSGRILSNLVNSNVSFLVYPNPTSGNFFIERKGEKTDSYSVSLYDNLGRMRATEILNAGKTEIKTVGLSPGIYFFEVFDSKRIVKDRGKLIFLNLQ